MTSGTQRSCGPLEEIEIAPCELERRLGGVLGEILLDDHGAVEVGLVHEGDNLGDVHCTIRQRTHDALAIAAPDAELAVKHALANGRVDVLQVYVSDAVADLAEIGER